MPNTACLREPDRPFRWCLEHQPRDGRKLNMPYCSECVKEKRPGPGIACFKKEPIDAFEWCSEHQPADALRQRIPSNGPYCAMPVLRGSAESPCCNVANYGLNGKRTWCKAHAPSGAREPRKRVYRWDLLNGKYRKAAPTCLFCTRHKHEHGMRDSYKRQGFAPSHRFPTCCTPYRCKEPAVRMRLPPMDNHNITEIHPNDSVQIFCARHYPRGSRTAIAHEVLTHEPVMPRKEYCDLCQGDRQTKDKKSTMKVRHTESDPAFTHLLAPRTKRALTNYPNTIKADATYMATCAKSA
jgi:hypothetical protein